MISASRFLLVVLFGLATLSCLTSAGRPVYCNHTALLIALAAEADAEAAAGNATAILASIQQDASDAATLAATANNLLLDSYQQAIQARYGSQAGVDNFFTDYNAFSQALGNATIVNQTAQSALPQISPYAAEAAAAAAVAQAAAATVDICPADKAAAAQAAADALQYADTAAQAVTNATALVGQTSNSLESIINLQSTLDGYVDDVVPAISRYGLTDPRNSS